MLAEETLFNVLAKTGIIERVKDDVGDFVKEIAEQIEFKKYRDYPLGDSFCIDYVESNKKEDFVCIFRMNKAGMKLASVPAILFNNAISTIFSTTSIS